MFRKAAIAILAVAGLASTTTSRAQANFDDQKALLDAQTELASKQIQLREVMQRLAGPMMSGLPSVVAIVGIDGRLTARLLQTNGVVGNYYEGETVRPGVVVASITPRSVMVKVGQGTKARAVPLDLLAGAASQNAANGGGSGVPPIPPELLPEPPGVRLPSNSAAARGALLTPKAAPAPASAGAGAPSPQAPMTASQAAATPASANK